MAQRGAYAKGIAKREEILGAALDVIAKHGYRSASVRELADAVSLSPAGLLHYFDSKEELFTAILRKRDEVDVEAYGDQGSDLGMLQAVIRHNATVPGLAKLYTQLAADATDPEHPAREFFLTRAAGLKATFRDAVVRAQERGEIRAELDPDWVATAVHALADGLQSMWLLDPELDMAAQLRNFIDALRPSPPIPPSPEENA